MILRAPNTDRLIEGKPRTQLTSPQDAGSSTITVENISTFAVGNYIILGVLGEGRSEVIRIHASSAPSGSTITLASNTLFRHEIGTPVYFTDYNQVEFSRATTLTGSKSTLATSGMAVDQMDTIYDDTTNTTGFGFYRFKNSASSTFGPYSDAIPYAGYEIDAVQTIIDRALSITSSVISPRLKYDDLFKFVNDAITILNSKNAHWSEAKVLGYELDTISTGDWEWDLPTNIARANDPTAIMALYVRGYPPMRYKPQREWNQWLRDLVFTTLATDVALIDTTIVLTNSKGFADSGTIYIEGDAISYTGNTRSTGTLTGVTGITATHTAGSTIYVFQNFTPAEPSIYTITSEGLAMHEACLRL